MNEYYTKRKKAYKNLAYYLYFNVIFTLFNIILIIIKPSYKFPENFFAIWPILGWGIPTIFKFLELRRYKRT
ncbi:2TM domain-containing protein [Rummeliibacillus suwonensis]|uniref:2TM domain-containing protein n=1 Tax=Rummeliibacillus suwonensis TaxID=1306154 RepID=UPI001AAEDFFC|nr:2TM domain-containing protein [Rummeliibacillus suwonensis]MBO2535786.1 2TM domain-containing protein [Rummeliibacillus suwonensis]